jgi:hypothetical protein
MKQALKHLQNVLGGKKGDSMRKTMVLMSVEALLFLGAAFAVTPPSGCSASAVHPIAADT